MLKQKVTILLIGLMCFSSVSGFFTVICHGSDGHIALEHVFHNHCECPEFGETGNQNTFNGIAIDVSRDHDHCKDTIATSNFFISKRKNSKLLTLKVFTTNFPLKSVSPYITSPPGYLFMKLDALSSFFTPLRTLILLV